MSNKELLQQNNSKYASLIELLRNKAINGGGSILLQEKTITPSTSLQSVTPDSGYDGLSKVTVNAMPTATQATPSISVNSGGLITASSTQSAGYVASGTKNATKQLTTQAAKTITPGTSSQTAVASGRYTTGAVTVAAIPSSYVQPSGTKTITANGTYDIKSYASATVNVAGGGSGGGENIETCTVVLDANETGYVVKYGTIYGYVFTVYENGQVFTKCLFDTSIYEPTTITNVVSGTQCMILTDSTSDSWTLQNGVSLEKQLSPAIFIFNIDTPNGETAIMTYA